jgi:hypothetical protein
VKGLADTGFVKNDLPEDCRQLLLKEVLGNVDQMNHQDITMTVLGWENSVFHLSPSNLFFFCSLGRMNWKWEEFSLDTQKTMMERCIVTLRDGNEVVLSALLNGFKTIDYRWTDSDSVKQAVFAGIVKNFGHGNTNTASGRELANIIYFLGKSEIQWENIRKDVRDSLFRGISHCYRSFNEQEISNIIHG